MLQQTVFGLSVAFSFVAWSLVTRDFVWPALNGRSRADALRPLLILHSFRFVGLSFLIPGVPAIVPPTAILGARSPSSKAAQSTRHRRRGDDHQRRSGFL